MTRSSVYVRSLLLLLIAAAVLIGAVFFFTQTVAAHEGDESISTSSSGGIPNKPPLPGSKPPLPSALKVGEIKDRIQNKLASTSSLVREKLGERKDGQMPPHMSTSTAGQGTSTLRMRFEQEQQKMKEKQAARQTELKNKLAKQGQEQYEKVIKRLAAAVLRLSDIADRIDSRIGKLQDAGIAMDTAKTLMVTARGKITDANAKVKAIPAPTFPDTADASTTPAMINGALKPTREAAMSAQQAIVDAQKALEAAVREIRAKGGLKADEDRGDHATSTEEGTH